MVQRLAARFVCHNYSRKGSVTEMLETLRWRSLLQRRADIRLVTFYNCVHRLVAVRITESDHLQHQSRSSRQRL
jgi:hypothetical protein